MSSAMAAEPASDRARAEQHFEAGKKLRKEGKCAQAVEELKASIDFEPTSVGARLNLGDCYVVLNKLPEAFRAYKEAEGYAQSGKDARIDDARKSGAAVLAKLVRVVLREEDAAIPNVNVTVDGASAGARPWANIAVMPNTDHVIEATSADGRKWSATAKGKEGDVVRLMIALRQPDDPKPAPPPPPIVESPQPAPPRQQPESSSLRTAGLVVSGVGGVFVLAGGIAGLVALNARSELADAVDANNACAGGYPRGSCDPSARKDLEPIQDRAFATATLSTVGLITGAVLVAGGITLYLLAPAPGSTVDKLRARASTSGLWLEGSF